MAEEKSPQTGMTCLESTSVKCEINDRNLDILKEALSKELGIDATCWIENELDFAIDNENINVHVTFADLPDSKGYSIRAWGQLTKSGIYNRYDWSVLGLIFGILSIAGWWWFIKMLINIKQYSFIGWNLPTTLLVFILLVLSVFFYAAVKLSADYYSFESAKKTMEKAFDQAFSIF